MATLCKNCVSGYVLPGEPKGTIKDGAYVYSYAPEQSGSQDGIPHLTGKTAIILLTDAFGLDLKNSKILADSFGERLKCDVLVPDLFNGTFIPYRFRRTGAEDQTFIDTWCRISSGHPPFSEADLAPYTGDVPGEMSNLSWIKLLKFAMVWVRAAPSLWSGRPAVGLTRAETVRDPSLHDQPLGYPDGSEHSTLIR
jgi:hypothetical protein